MCTYPKTKRNYTSRTVFPIKAMALSLVVFPITLVQAQTSIWDGSVDGTWGDSENWSAGVPNGTSSIAEFSSTSPNTSVNLDTAVELQRLDFLSGASSYDLSGSALTLTAASGDTFIVNSSGAVQAISSNVTFNIYGAGTAINVGVDSGSTLTLSGLLATNGTTNGRSITFSGGGTVNIASGATFSSINALESASGTSLNFYATNSANINNFYASTGGRINLFANLNSSRGLIVEGDGAGIYLSQSDLTLSGSNPAIGVNMRGKTAGATVTLGSDFSGTGTANVYKNIFLNQASTAAENVTYRFYAATDNTLNLAGVISDSATSGTGTVVEISGGGTVLYSGSSANTSITPIVISSGVLQLGKSTGIDAIAGGSVTIQENGELLLVNGNQIADGVAIILEGGSFNVSSKTETVGSLSVTFGGSLSVEAGAGITFSSLSELSGILTIYGWSDASSIIFNDTSGWTESALANVIFDGYGQGAAIDGNELVYAIPEASSSALLLTAIAALIVFRMKRRK
ncbi:MAG: cell wall anchor protein [Verrucomicrobiota bacterium JB024]|nr:cell wall anchor protein [Verrucomicrobiota bacterium JB024]